MKSRIIVWSLVGLVAVIGVIVIATAPKAARGPKMTLDLVKNEAAEAEAQLDRLVARLDARRKSTAPGTGVEAFDEADRLLVEARDKIGQARQATGVKQARQLLIEGREVLRTARRAVVVATKPARRPSGF